MPLASTNPTLIPADHKDGKLFRLADFFSSLLKVKVTGLTLKRVNGTVVAQCRNVRKMALGLAFQLIIAIKACRRKVVVQ